MPAEVGSDVGSFQADECIAALFARVHVARRSTEFLMRLVPQLVRRTHRILRHERPPCSCSGTNTRMRIHSRETVGVLLVILHVSCWVLEAAGVQ